MISLTYSKDVVRWVHFRDNSVLKPTADDLKETHRQLKQAFEKILNVILPDFPTLEMNKRVRSQLVLLSQVSPGGTTRSRVRNACRLLVHTKPL